MQILDFKGDYVNLLYVLLLYSGKYDFLPDLYDTIGEEMTLKLLDVFAGSKIRFPSSEELKRLISEVRIYMRLKAAQKKHQPAIVRDIADELIITEATVRNIYSRVAKIVEKDLGMEVLGGRRRFREHNFTPTGSSNRRRKEGS